MEIPVFLTGGSKKKRQILFSNIFIIMELVIYGSVSQPQGLGDPLTGT